MHAGKVVLEHNPLHQAERYPVFEYPNHLIDLFEWSNPLRDGDDEQEKNEDKEIYNTGTVFSDHAMLRGIRLLSIMGPSDRKGKGPLGRTSSVGGSCTI